MPGAERGAPIACEGFRKRSANAIEFGGFAQHDEHSVAVQKWRNPNTRGVRRKRLVWAHAEHVQLTLDLRECARKLLPACGMCRGLKLTADFGEGQSKRFCPPQLLGIAIAFRHRSASPLFFPLVHPFLDAILCVDKSFA